MKNCLIVLCTFAFLSPLSSVYAAEALPVGSIFSYSFSTNGTLHETGSMDESSSPYFWLNSGGKFVLQDGTGSTVAGSLPLTDLWHRLYAAANPLDTDDGAHPQNLFRLLTRSTWRNVEQKLSFRIDAVHTTDTPNRDGYSGILLFSRYTDNNNLYYAGIRHDGSAVIKKKYNGTYYTLASAQVFGNASEYDRDTNPNLIPEDRWMRIKVRTVNQSDGSVTVDLYLDRENDGSYAKILSATDTGTQGKALRSSGSIGIRTDYMDVRFDNFVATKL
ncbi:MAG TPA: hypothetical protein VEB18_03245 [Candidatus Paceibacterota bacterium]|nr:hypothetical protein [Candidatus Paceibacterota bacterium]